MATAIISDCFGVLYGGALQMLRSLSPQDALPELDNLAKLFDYGYLSRDEFTASIAGIMGRTVDEADTIITSQRQRNVELVDYIKSLHARGYKTALLSNIGSDTIGRLIPTEEQREMFDVVVLSYEVQLRKPDDRIYLLTAERLGMQPQDCIMIDDMRENCEGAELVGMRAICHETNEATRAQLEAMLR